MLPLRLAWWLGSPAARRLTTSCLLVLTGPRAAAQTQVWIEQVGSSFSDSCAIAVDGSGGIFVGGMASADLGGPSLGSLDAWLGRYDGAGGLLWITQFGTTEPDGVMGLAADGAGGVLLCGLTAGALAAPSAGFYDAWIARRDAANGTLWIQQIGTAQEDVATVITSDGSGGALVAGTSTGSLGGPHVGVLYNDAWLARYDASGAQLWIRQFGSIQREDVYGIAGDGQGGAFVAGNTWGDLASASNGGVDAFVARFGPSGTLQWMQQFGTNGWDSAHGVTTDGAGGVYLCGVTTRGLFGEPAGADDAWCARFDGAGNLVWGRQLGTPATDGAFGIAASSMGGAIVTGTTSGTLGASAQGSGDVWLARFDALGEHEPVHQFGSADSDSGSSIAVSGATDVFLCGTTLGALGGPPAGALDAWFARFDVPCSDGETYCVASATSLAGCQAAIHASGDPSLADAQGFVVGSGPIPGGNPGIAIFGTGASFDYPVGTLGGLLCFFPPIFRTQLIAGSGSIGACDGAVQATLSDLLQAAPTLAPGAGVRVQLWVRDPANADGFLLSDALHFTVCP